MIGTILFILIALVILSLLLLLHELGHFFAARATRTTVKELGVGFPPRLLSMRRGGIAYSINAIPFGAFVRLDDEEDPTVPGGFAGKPVRVRAFIIVAGCLANLLLAWTIFSGLAALPYQAYEGDVTIEEVAPGSPAAEAGLQPQDVIAAINGEPVRTLGQLSARTSLAAGQPATLRVLRSAVPRAVTLVPRTQPPAGEGPMGIRPSLENPVLVTYRPPLWRAPLEGLRIGLVVAALTGGEVRHWVRGSSVPTLTGPVGIAQATAETARNGLLPLFLWVGLLSLALGLFNLLPIPALDGGRLPFLLLEALRHGRRISPRRENLVHMVGFAVLVTILLYVTISSDIPNLLRGERLLPGG